MADDVILNKAAMIERCLARIVEEYRGHEHELESNLTRQDAIVLNLQRTCEAAIDLAMHVVRVRRLGLPQESREAFTLLEQAGLLDAKTGQRMRAMVGFRNVAVHNYQALSLPIMRAILEKHLDDFRAFTATVLRGTQ
ncbi:MAG TPA: DUF86 domain-containing protein [Gammaproteobacteria bacterium]|nr:DUF86 domain-containing protein [Gammaproteobacteria bacterium]